MTIRNIKLNSAQYGALESIIDRRVRELQESVQDETMKYFGAEELLGIVKGIQSAIKEAE